MLHIKKNKMQNTVKDLDSNASVPVLFCQAGTRIPLSLTAGLTIPCYKFKIQASQRRAWGEWILL